MSDAALPTGHATAAGTARAHPLHARLPPRHRRARRTFRVDLLPLIDVVFLLLAVMLLSMVRMVRSWTLPIDLPAAASGEALEAPTVLLVAIDAEGRWFVGGEPIGRDGIAERVRGALGADPALAVLVQADREARHGDVAALLDDLRVAGAPRVLFVAAQPGPGDALAPGAGEDGR